MKALEIVNLTKKYRNGRGITDINLEINRGDIFGFLGPNGAGKTTTMKAATGLCRIDQGEIRIFGHDIHRDFEKAMSKTGCIIESCEAYDYLSAKKNLQLIARYHEGISMARIEEVLETVGLRNVMNERTAGFSLGMKQRLGLAAAMLAKPELLILDEPGNGLDIEGMVEIRSIIKRLAEEEKTTFLISSHQIHEIQQVCNRIAIINEGSILLNAYVEDMSGMNSLEDVYMKSIRKEKVS